MSDVLVTPSITQRFWSKVRITDGCWYWTAYTYDSGYGGLHVRANGKKTIALAHRLSWIIANGVIPEGLDVCHDCDVRNCVNPAHLFLGTHLENMADRNRKGRQASGDRQGLRLHPLSAPSGERNGRSKITAQMVQEIRFRYRAGGITQMELAAEYGIVQPQVSRIVRGKEWR